MSKGLNLLLSSNRGQFLPMNFAQEFDPIVWGLDASLNGDWVAVLAGPDNLEYWEAWDGILRNARFTDEAGNQWLLHQDGDLWAYCDALISDKEYSEFFGNCRHCGCHDCFGQCQEGFPEAPKEVCHVF